MALLPGQNIEGLEGSDFPVVIAVPGKLQGKMQLVVAGLDQMAVIPLGVTPSGLGELRHIVGIGVILRRVPHLHLPGREADVGEIQGF